MKCYKINISLQPAPGIQIVASVKVIKDCGTRKLPPSGADPGEVKWVNFQPLFLSPLPSFFFFCLSLQY